MRVQAPRMAGWVLGVLLPHAVREEALDELGDVYAVKVEGLGRVRAGMWYWRQIPGYVRRLRIGDGRLVEIESGTWATRGPEMSARWADLRYVVRTLVRSPGFTAVAVLTLALGIGANTAIFSVVRTVLLSPLPFPEAERIVELNETRVDRGWYGSSFTHGNYWAAQELSRSFESLGAYLPTFLNLTGFEYPERLRGGRVSADFLRVLGIVPVVGRFFTRDDDDPGSDARIAILSHRLWVRRFGSDPSVVGRSLMLDGASYTVIGVSPPADPLLSDVDIFVPLQRRPEVNHGSFELYVIGRLWRGVTEAGAQSDMDRVAHVLEERYPEVDAGMGIGVSTTESWVADEPTRRALWILMGGVGLLLIIACVNLANLLLARSTGRARERAMRVALGADRRSVAGLVLTESLILGVSGALLGLVLAGSTVRLIRTLDAVDVPRIGAAAIDGWVLGFTVIVSLLTGIVTGLVPAMRAPWDNISKVLREGGRHTTGSRHEGRVRGMLVATEVALSLVLLVGAGLLARSFSAVLGAERGFRTEGRIFFEIPPPSAYAEGNRSNLFQTGMLRRIESMPGVVSAAAVNVRPLGGVNVGMGYGAGDAADGNESVPWASWRAITPGYFETIGVPIVAGRDITPEEEVGKPWRVIVSERIAEELWPGENAVGRTVILWKGQSDERAEVIGVAGDMRDWGLEEGPSAGVYFPYNGFGDSSMQLVVHASVDPVTLVPAVRAALTEMDPNLPLENIETMDAMVGASVASRRFTLLLLGTFAGLALALALAGVYGVLSYAVARRRAEIGTRMALGASRASVVRLILVQGMRPVALGLFVGVAGALVLSRLLSSMLFEVSPADWQTYIFVVAALGISAVLSCWLPAHRATTLSVVTALREE